MGSIRSLDPAEDYAQRYLRQAAAQIIENTGFSHCSESALNLISDLTRRFMEKLWYDGKLFAEHAGRLEPNLQDAHVVFQKLQLRTTELSDYMRQVASHPISHKVARFPVSKNTSRSIYGSISERELAERPQHIPSYFPAVHPEWCADHVSPLEGQVAKQPPSIEVISTEKRRNVKLNVYPVKSKVPFPDFTGMTAKALGLVRQKRTSMATLNRVASEPSGISSSANLSSAQLNVSPSTSHANKSKHKKSSAAVKAIVKPPVTIPPPKPSVSVPELPIIVNEPLIEEPKSVEEKVSEDGSESPTVRPSGMFGKPPSAAVCNDNSFGGSEKSKKKKKKDKDGIVKVKEKKEKHKEKEKEKDKDKEKETSELKIHQETASSSNDVLLNDDVPLSILSSQVLGDRFNFGLSTASPLLQNDLDEKPCPILTPILSQRVSPVASLPKDEGPSRPPELVEQAIKPKKEFKRTKPEKARPKVKSVEIVPSDDSDSDTSCKATTNALNSASASSHGSSKVLEIKHSRDTNTKPHVTHLVKTGVMDKAKEREESGERLNKENQDERAKTSATGLALKASTSVTPVANTSVKTSNSSLTEVLRVNTGDEGPSFSIPKDEEPPIKMIISRPMGHSEFSAFSPTDKKLPQQKDLLSLSKTEPGAQDGSGLSIQSPVTIKLDAREESLRKEKKKKHKKDKERDHGEKIEGHRHHHHHKKKDKKKDKEHKKEKHSLKEPSGATEEVQSSRKRKGDSDLTDQQPELKIPKLKIKIGGSNTDTIRQPSKICPPVASSSLTAISKSIGKVNNKAPSSFDISSQNSVAAEKIHIPIKESVSEPISKIPNFCSVKDVQSVVKNKDDLRESKRLQCLTKAELKVVPKASKKAELPLFSAKTEGRKEEIFLSKEKAQKAEEKVIEKPRNESKRDERDRKKDRDKEAEKEREANRENGRTHDSEKDSFKDYERKDVRLKERDRKDKIDRDKSRDIENRKDLTKSKKDQSYEKEKKRQEDVAVTAGLFEERPLLKTNEKESCVEKSNHNKEGKPSKSVIPSGAAKKKKSAPTTSSKAGNNNDFSKTSIVKTSKEKRNFIADDDDVWICPECSVAYVDGATDMVCCDGCDNWFHWSCVGLLVAPPENTDWFCQGCMKKKNVKRVSISGKIGNTAKKPKKVV